jgi:hypothetical protein
VATLVAGILGVALVLDRSTGSASSGGFGGPGGFAPAGGGGSGGYADV